MSPRDDLSAPGAATAASGFRPPGRIAFFLPAASGGGAERAMIAVANQLAHSGEQVDLVLGRSKGPYIDTVSPAVRIVDLNAGRIRTMLRPLSAYIREERPRAVVSGLAGTSVVLMLGKLVLRWPVKVLLSVQNHPLGGADPSAPWLQRNLPLVVRTVYRHADQLVGISSGVAECVAELTGRPITQVPVIYNPVIGPDFLERLAGHAEHPWLSRRDAPVLLSAGRLTAQKDYPTLLRAFARVRAARPARLIVLGEGEQKSMLLALAKSLGVSKDIDFVGFVPNPYAWMKVADVFVLSSRWEGFANVVAEALACGAPVVSTDCPSGPAEILGDGVFGRLAPVGDDEALASAILATLQHPPERDALIRRGRSFNVESLAPKYAELVSAL